MLPKISIVIPAYNEEKRIESVVSNYIDYFDNQEIIIVCNGCIDNTVNIVEKYKSNYPQIKLLDFKQKIGKGRAIIEGFKIAQGNSIAFVDADESVKPKDMNRMFNALSDVDGVIASRKLKKSIIIMRQPLIRRIASKAFNLFIRVIFNLNFKDTQCGAKIFKKDAVNNVLSELNTNGFEFDVELLWRLKKKGYKIIEYPITWTHSGESTFSLLNAPKMFLSLIKVRIWK